MILECLGQLWEEESLLEKKITCFELDFFLQKEYKIWTESDLKTNE